MSITVSISDNYLITLKQITKHPLQSTARTII